jgi:hypothetical protein
LSSVLCSSALVVSSAAVVAPVRAQVPVAPASASVSPSPSAMSAPTAAAPAPLVVGPAGAPAPAPATTSPVLLPTGSAAPPVALLPVPTSPPPAQEAEPDEPHDPDLARRETLRRKFGVQVSILGPNAFAGIGFAAQLAPHFEGIVSLGYIKSQATEQTAAATAEASARLLTPMVRGRVWLFARHSLLLDGGAGMSFLDLSADGQNRDGTDPIHYERSGASPIFTAAVGYGYRSPAAFRFSVLLGVQGMVANLGDSKLTAAGSYTAKELADLKKTLDDASHQLGAINHAFLEMNVAFLF